MLCDAECSRQFVSMEPEEAKAASLADYRKRQIISLLLLFWALTAFNMSGQQHSGNVETLFSFELFVEYVRIEKESEGPDELALGVRLLDFPTLLIYQPKRSSDALHRRGQQQAEYVFNRGKSCFFNMNLNSMHNQLFMNPLYAMVLDAKEDIPKLVGTSLISLAKVMDKIRQDVSEHGASSPLSHGERGLFSVCNLQEEKVGSISLSYKLSVGVGLLPHSADISGDKSTSVQGEQEKSIVENESKKNNLINEDKQDGRVCVGMQTEPKPKSQTPQTPKDTENSFEEDLTVFCPPHLFYINSSEEKRKKEEGVCRFLNLDSEAFKFNDTTYSEEETCDGEIDGTSNPIVNQRVRHDVKTSREQQASEATPNVLAEALQQLPLLNALLVELSQLNGQNPQRPLSVHPNLAWIYGPASAEFSDERGNAARKVRATSVQGDRHMAPRSCSTPVGSTASVKVHDKQERALTESKNSSTSPRKKLVCGTTKTFNLRLKQISPRRVKGRECVELVKKETKSSTAKGKTKSSNKIMKSSKGKSALQQSSGLNDNIETLVRSITEDSAPQETATLKQKNMREKDCKQERCSPGISKKPSLSERGLKARHLPSADSDSVAKHKTERHSESNQSQSDSDKHRDEMESPGHRSPKSSLSDSSGEGNEEEDYADDFNSLEPSDACSPVPSSSHESPRAKTPRSPVRHDFHNSDSGSEGFQSTGVLPVPIKAPSSPQHALRGTHIIRPRTHTSALSFSSDDGDREGLASSQTVCSRKLIGGVGRTSVANSVMSSRGQTSESTKNSDTVRGFSAESDSFEPQEAEELGEELGTLDFRKEYRHISELVASKLPGYTL